MLQSTPGLAECAFVPRAPRCANLAMLRLGWNVE
jgi:hypothetical protein